MLDLNQYNFIHSFARLHQKIRQEIVETFFHGYSVLKNLFFCLCGEEEWNLQGECNNSRITSHHK